VSIRLLSVVWEHAPYEAGSLLVLLAMADYCNDDCQCWPRVESIAKKARLGVRQTHNVLRQLRKDGVLSVEQGGGRGVPSRYRLCVETLKSISVKSDSVKPVSVKSMTKTLHYNSENGAIRSNAIRKNRQEPSKEPTAKSSFSQRRLPGSPNPNCKKCGGTGRYESTAHPGEPYVCWCLGGYIA
jgi:hypothetical protein